MTPRLRRRRDPVVEPPSASSTEDDDESEEIILNQKSTNIVTQRGESEKIEEEEDTDEETDVSESDGFACLPDYVAPPSSDDKDSSSSDDVASPPPPSISNKPLSASTKSRKSHRQAVAATEAILDLASPVPNKPLAASTKSKKSHPQTTAAAAAAVTHGRKEIRKETPKKKDNTSNGEEKSAIYWSLEDEIAMLEGMFDYQQTNGGGDPLAKDDAASFYDFIKKKLPNEVSKAKMVDKINRLKKKYQNIAENGGKKPVSTQTHDLKFLELSKKIWGGNVGIENVVFSNGSSKKQKKMVEVDNKDSPIPPKESEDFWEKYPLLEESLLSEKLRPLEIPVLDDDVHFAKETMSLIGSSKASELEEKWKKLKIEELELHVKKLKLIHHQTQLMEEAFKSSSSSSS